MSYAENSLKGHQRIFRLNMLIGFALACFSIFMIITGTYENIQARQAAESLFGWLAIIGMLYSVGFWFACLFRQQIFLNTGKSS